MRRIYAEQFRCACIVIEEGDSFEEIVEECLFNGAFLVEEGGDEFCVQMPGRDFPEVYTSEALRRSLTKE